MYWQYGTLIVSIVYLLSTIYLASRWTQRTLFYCLMAMGWLLNIVYYSSVLEIFGFKFITNPHEWSQAMRLIQSFLFGGWFFLDAIDCLCQKVTCSKLVKKLGKIYGR